MIIELFLSCAWFPTFGLWRRCAAPPKPHPGQQAGGGRIPGRLYRPDSTTVPLQWPMNASSFWRMLLLSLGADKPLAWIGAAAACATLTGRGGPMLSNAWLFKADRQVLSAALGAEWKYAARGATISL